MSSQGPTFQSRLQQIRDPDLAEVRDERRRYFDKRFGGYVVQICQGDFYVTNRKDEVLSTILGSCISACVRDPVLRLGGMNHFLLPSTSDPDEEAMASLRYGSFAMEQLINDILKSGGRRDRLEIKVFGGGNVVKNILGVGHKNADFIETYLENEGLPIAAKHLRGNSPRKILYFPQTGRVKMRELASVAATELHQREISRAVRVEKTDDAIELFD